MPEKHRQSKADAARRMQHTSGTLVPFVPNAGATHHHATLQPSGASTNNVVPNFGYKIHKEHTPHLEPANIMQHTSGASTIIEPANCPSCQSDAARAKRMQPEGCREHHTPSGSLNTARAKPMGCSIHLGAIEKQSQTDAGNTTHTIM